MMEMNVKTMIVTLDDVGHEQRGLGRRAVEPAVMQITSQLKVEKVSAQLLFQPSRVGRVELDPKTEDNRVET